MCIEFMADHIARLAEKGIGNVNYILSTIFMKNPFMAECVISKIFEEIKRRKWFLFVPDSIANMSRYDQ